MEKTKQKNRIQLSYVIKDPIEKLNRNGVNCLKYDSKNDRLYAAGRDSIIRAYNPSSNTDPYLNSFQHHSDWINDIVLCNNGDTLFSASSDTTIKVWNAKKGVHLNTLRMHKDYVKCLAYAKDRDIMASAGFDKSIFIWDAQTALTTASIKMQPIEDNKYSLYSLALNSQGTVLASGSAENCIRIWDPRTCNKIMKLKGHTHNIRSLILNKDGTQLLSASSDHTIRLWSIGQQRCISTIELHAQGVWALCVNDSFNKILSGGKDSKVYLTDLKYPDNSTLVCEEEAPILSIDYGHDQESIWVSTTNTDIKNWSLKEAATASTRGDDSTDYNSLIKPASSSTVDVQEMMIDDYVSTKVLNENAQKVIKGGSSIKQYHILNDKRFIVTKDTEDNVAIYDVLKAKGVEHLGRVNFENVIKARQKFISVPNWFTVDLKLGLLTINLDEDCLTAWLNYNKETSDLDNSFVAESYENKINYGCLLLEALLRQCPFVNPNQQQNNDSLKSNSSLSLHIPDHIPITFSEIAGRTLYRVEHKDIGRESEQQALTNVLPIWILDPLTNRNLPKFNKIVFLLNPHQQNVNSKTPLNKDRLTSIDLLQVKKLKEHVYQKILKLNETSQNGENSNNNQMDTTTPATGQAPTSTGTNGNNMASSSTASNLSSSSDSKLNSQQDQAAVIERSIEIYCSDQLLSDPELDLRTIKQLIWKGSGDLILFYRLKN